MVSHYLTISVVEPFHFGPAPAPAPAPALAMYIVQNLLQKKKF